MARTIRTQVDSGLNSGIFVIDAETRANPVAFVGDALTLQLGCFSYGSPRNLAEFATFNVILRETQLSGSTIFAQKTGLTVDNNTITTSAWNAGTTFHFDVDFTSVDLSVSLGLETSIDAWIVVVGVTSGGDEVTLGAGPLVITDDASVAAVSNIYMLKSDYDSDDDGIVESADVAFSVDWSNITNIPASFSPTTHTHAASDVTAGTFADARISQSSVTQHEAAIDHDALTNFAADEHRPVLVGTAAARPAASTANRFYWATDTGVLSRDTGATWQPVVAGDADTLDGIDSTGFSLSGHVHSVFSSGSNGFAPAAGTVTGTRVLYDNGTWNTINSPTYTVFTDGSNGLVPDPIAADNTRYLRDDATWVTPPGSSVFEAGLDGLVPDPVTETGTKYLRDDATWQTISTGQTVYWTFEVYPEGEAVDTIGTYNWITNIPVAFTVEEIFVNFEENTGTVTWMVNDAATSNQVLNAAVATTGKQGSSTDIHTTNFPGGVIPAGTQLTWGATIISAYATVTGAQVVLKGTY